MSENETARSLAVDALTRVAGGAYSNLQLEKIIDRSSLNDADRRLLTNLVYGTIQHQLTLEYYLDAFVKPNQKLQPWVKMTLLVALYQMLYLDRVPNWAIFDEAIQLAKERGHEGIRRFVTGVLHAVDREGVPDVSQIADPTERLSVTYSMPQWLVTTLQQQLGEAKTESILKTINQPAAQSVRVNTAVTTVDAAIQALEAVGYTVDVSTVSGDGLRVDGHPANHSELFENGQLTIQDESAMLPVEALQVQPGDQVLDACAAPGGKTTQIAAALDPQAGGQVTALDLHAKKVKLIAQNAARLRVADRVNAMALDARKVDDEFADDTFDKILVDAPCSGIGLVRRKPEIRYDKTPEDSQHLQKIQLAILDAVSKKLKPQGLLVYSTCTILDTENADVVASFLKTHPNFEAVRVTTTRNVKADRTTDTLSIYPDDFDTDGFFVSALRRKA
ncbi:16S rRNA (cytosine(967)-C(5))-methyltransferase RsmB [Levilactobacillus spicheri]|uniref:16S rRNA (cytosine(967)-C(5))-methyltransferase n=2 Tax=Levilactobacillus spicheri TaxID=216463 RepID=A0ABQ0WN88_9LACO|nr:16S rRNA (cytosine(967)-C(5))-methyltransferase RsmB [Levilactobacillus spicheri]KRL46375.1 tRNA and rRNA cytosine-C5-methylase [Levilactobacillus spicheri DSM 15429]GEO66259.1 ribosomal RNA small subunit methyltransferase B [Levilactobacillus spicheri]